MLLVEDELNSVTISKKAVSGSEELPGATLKVTDSKGTEVDTWISGSVAHTISGLTVGETYTLEETIAPAGYTIASKIEFTVDKDGNVTAGGTVVEGGVILVEDAPTSVKVSKVDIANGKEVAGATIQVLDDKGTEVTSWTSDGKTAHEITGLKTGVEYTLRETVAPTGYAIATDITFTIDETEVSLTVGDVLTEPMHKPGFTSAEDRGVTVVLDTNLTDELIAEGYAREVISKVQTMRKDAGFEVTDRISLSYECDDVLAAALAKFEEMIARTTLATGITRGAAPEGAVSQEWDINGKKATLAITKA